MATDKRVTFNQHGDPVVTVTITGWDDAFRFAWALAHLQCEFADRGRLIGGSLKRRLGTARCIEQLAVALASDTEVCDYLAGWYCGTETVGGRERRAMTQTTEERAAIIERSHLLHFRNCNCLRASAECCRSSCACHEGWYMAYFEDEGGTPPTTKEPGRHRGECG